MLFALLVQGLLSTIAALVKHLTLLRIISSLAPQNAQNSVPTASSNKQSAQMVIA
jgi:hypothetical protein